MKNLKIAFFGTDEISVYVLDELIKAGFDVNLIISTPDKKEGRGMKLTPTPTKIWAEKNNIPILQPEKLKGDFAEELKKTDWDLFIVASYGKIIPEEVFELPKYKTLNVHPSLLPLYRGPSPIESAILDDALETGVTIMRIGKGVDDGPIIDQEFVTFEEWEKKPIIAEKLARAGGKLLTKSIEPWINGKTEEQEQDNSFATHTKKITKEDGELKKEETDREKFLKIMAFQPWPGAYFFENNKRIKVTDAKFDRENQKLEILKVIPEGKKEMNYQDFKKSTFTEPR